MLSRRRCLCFLAQFACHFEVNKVHFDDSQVILKVLWMIQLGCFPHHLDYVPYDA